MPTSKENWQSQDIVKVNYVSFDSSPATVSLLALWCGSFFDVAQRPCLYTRRGDLRADIMGTKRRRNGEDVSLADTSFAETTKEPPSPTPVPRPQTPPPRTAHEDDSTDDVHPQANSTKTEPVDEDILFSDDNGAVLNSTTKIEPDVDAVLNSTTKIEDDEQDVLPPLLAQPSLRPDSRLSIGEDLPLKMLS